MATASTTSSLERPPPTRTEPVPGPASRVRASRRLSGRARPFGARRHGRLPDQRRGGVRLQRNVGRVGGRRERRRLRRPDHRGSRRGRWRGRKLRRFRSGRGFRRRAGPVGPRRDKRLQDHRDVSGPCRLLGVLGRRHERRRLRRPSRRSAGRGRELRDLRAGHRTDRSCRHELGRPPVRRRLPGYPRRARRQRCPRRSRRRRHHARRHRRRYLRRRQCRRRGHGEGRRRRRHGARLDQLQARRKRQQPDAHRQLPTSTEPAPAPPTR